MGVERLTGQRILSQGLRRWVFDKKRPRRLLWEPQKPEKKRVWKSLGRVFLPSGFPSSVTPDYTPSMALSFVASVSGTMTGTLSTQALLQALGLGAGTAIGLAASTHWLIKDGFGLLGGVLFAGLVGSRFDASPKRFRFWAAVSIQASTLLELLTPFFPGSFLFLASISNIGKNIGWLAASASRATMNKGFAKRDNLGDVTAKAGAQGTLAGLLGTGLGIGLSWWVSTTTLMASSMVESPIESSNAVLDPTLLCTIFVPLASINLLASYYANAVVVTRSLNVERLERALLPLVHSLVPLSSSISLLDGPLLIEKRRLFNPLQVSKQESILRNSRVFQVPLIIDSPLDQVIHSPKMFSVFHPSEAHSTTDPQYRIWIQTVNVESRFLPSFHSSSRSKTSVYLWFWDGASDKTLIQGIFHASLIRRLLEKGCDQNSVMEKSQEILQSQKNLDMIQELQDIGWETKNLHVGDKSLRIRMETLTS